MPIFQSYARKGAIIARAYQSGDDLSGIPFSSDIQQPGGGDYFWRWASEPEHITRVTTGKYLHDHFQLAATP